MQQNNHRWQRFERSVKNIRARDKLGLAVGLADATPVFDNQPSDHPAIELLTIAETARLLKISKSGVRRLQQGRHISFFKVGGGIRFARSDLTSYLAQQRVNSVGK